MLKRKIPPVEVTGMPFDVWRPTLVADDGEISMRWWSVGPQELYGSEDYEPWDDRTGSDIPPF